MGLPALSSVGASLLSKLEGLTSSKASKTNHAPAPVSSSTADASSVSNPGMLFSQLQNLSRQNPAEFKKITAQVGQQLQAASGGSTSSTASAHSSVLSQMARNFQHASQTGSFSDLFTHTPQTAPTAASGTLHHAYTAASGASEATSISSIFSHALSQIKVDLGPSAALKTSAV